MNKFETVFMRFTVTSILLIMLTLLCAGVCESYARVYANITGESPVSAKAAVEKAAAEFEKIVNF